jgi:hypothetical protein
VLVTLNFGATNQDIVYALRSDESSVYGIKLQDFEKLAQASWQFRDRQIWQVSTNDLKGVRIEQGQQKREFLRKEAYAWAFAPGSQGILNDLAVEETVRGLCYAESSWWVAKGAANRAQYGFTEAGLKVVLLLKSGKELALEFGGQSPTSFPYAGVELDADFWICEFSWPLYRDITSYLAITPANR